MLVRSCVAVSSRMPPPGMCGGIGILFFLAGPLATGQPDKSSSFVEISLSSDCQFERLFGAQHASCRPVYARTRLHRLQEAWLTAECVWEHLIGPNTIYLIELTHRLVGWGWPIEPWCCAHLVKRRETNAYVYILLANIHANIC